MEALEQLLDAGRDEDALAWVDSRWPRPAIEGAISLGRLRGLLRAWPRRAALELGEASAEELARPEVAAAVADEALALPDKAIEALLTLEAPFLPELRAVREASRAVGEGRDEEALDALRGISLRSPFREARLFLRGLAAFYDGRDEEAREALRRISRDGCQWPAASALLVVLEPEKRTLGAVTEALPMLRALGLDRVCDELLLDQVRRRVIEGRANAALRTVSKVLPLASPGLATTLRRDLPAALLARGIKPEGVVERLVRALGTDPDDPRGRRLAAWLSEAAGDLDRAVAEWLTVAEEVRAGKLEVATGDGPLLSSAISSHIGHIILRCARVDEERARSDPFSRWSRRKRRSALWERAFEVFADATALDPGNIEAWQGQLEAAEHLADRRERVRVLERFVEQFPERAEALVAAARAAGERGAYDKGLRFARRAAALEPLNRSVGDIEAWLLCGKGRKKLLDGKTDAAKRLYHDAVAMVSKCTGAQRMRAMAAAAAFELALGDGQAALSIEDDLLAGDSRPWVFRAHLCLALQALNDGGLRRRPHRRVPAREPFDRPAVSPPRKAPSGDEVVTLLALDSEHEERTARPCVALRRLLLAALEAGVDAMNEPDHLHSAIEVADTLELRLRLAERGQALAPDDARFVAIRYGAALKLSRPASYFERAVPEIEEARQALRSTLDVHRESFDRATVRLLRRRLSTIERYLDELTHDIEQYVARSTPVKEPGRRARASAGARQLPLFRKE